MSSFIHKKLASSKTLPEILKEERFRADLSLDEVSFETHIPTKYLEALEQGTYEKLPGEVYNKQYIKKLAKLFSLSEKNLLTIYQQEKASQLSFQEVFHKSPPTKNLFFWLSPKLLRHGLITLLIIACLTYLGWEISNIFSAPLLEINSPTSQTITQEANIKIDGQTEPEAILTINNQEILPKPDGTFTETVDLTMGLNIFNISAKKKHSKVSTITLSILREKTITYSKPGLVNN